MTRSILKSTGDSSGKWVDSASPTENSRGYVRLIFQSLWAAAGGPTGVALDTYILILRYMYVVFIYLGIYV